MQFKSDIMDTIRAQEDATIATFAKKGTFFTLYEDGAKNSLKEHKSHLGRATMTAARPVKAVDDFPCFATSMERSMEAYYFKSKSMELAYKHRIRGNQKMGEQEINIAFLLLA